MARKTVLRRLSKRLPISSDLDDLIRRDDALYQFDEAKADAQKHLPRSLAGKLDALANPAPRTAVIEHQAPAVSEEERDAAEAPIESGPQPAKVTSGKIGPTEADPAASDAGSSDDAGDDGRFPPAEGEAIDPIVNARQRGREAKEAGLGTRAMPGEYRAEGREAEAEAWMAGHKGAQMAEAR